MDKIIGYLPMTADLFHVGHLSAISKALNNCDELIIGLLTDEAIEKYKSKRPIISYDDREIMLRSCFLVDDVVRQDDIDLSKNLIKYKVNIVFSGDDFEKEELEAIKKAGCRFKVLGYYPHESTTKIKERIKNDL